MQKDMNASTKFVFLWVGLSTDCSKFMTQIQKMMENIYRGELENELNVSLKLFTISKVYIVQKMDKMMSNPEMEINKSQKLNWGGGNSWE